MDSKRTKLASAVFISGLLILSACVNATPQPLPAAPGTASALPTGAPLPVSSPTSNPTSTAAPLILNPQVFTLADNLPGPDDLLLAADGSILLSDVSDGTIRQYTPDGRISVVLSGLNEPEGMAFLPDGSLIIAEQGKNRLTRRDPSSGNLTPFLSLQNHTNNLGVDGILWTGSELIVPDSPNGKILSVTPDGLTVRQIAAGFARPTGAWMESTGDLLIADENGDAVFRVSADGTFRKVADFSVPDDVIQDGSGNIFVTTLGDDAIHLLKAQTGEDVILVSGLKDPQGIIFDAGGNLIVADPGNHRLLKVVIH